MHVACTINIPFYPIADINWSWYVFLSSSVVVSEALLTQWMFQTAITDWSELALEFKPICMLGVRNEWEIGYDYTHSANQLLLFQMKLAEICTKSEHYIGTEGGGMDQSISFLAEEGTVGGMSSLEESTRESSRGEERLEISSVLGSGQPVLWGSVEGGVSHPPCHSGLRPVHLLCFMLVTSPFHFQNHTSSLFSFVSDCFPPPISLHC